MGSEAASATVTIWTDHDGETIRAVERMTLTDLEQLISDEPLSATKDVLPMLKLATFGDKRTKKNSLRTNENVRSVTGVEGDYDGEVMPMAAAEAKLRAAGVNALLYTSARHAPEKPRWRVLCLLARELTGPPSALDRDRKHLVGVLNALLGDALTNESKTLSLSYYFGGLAGKPAPETILINGGCELDQLPNPPAPIFPRSKKAKARSTDAVRDAFVRMEGRYELMNKLSWEWRHKNPEDSERKLAELLALSASPFNAAGIDLRTRIRPLVESAVAKVEEEVSAALAEMNAKHAVVSWKGKVVVLTEKRDPNFQRMTFELSSAGDLYNWYANAPAPKGGNNKGEWWFKHAARRQYESVSFVPGGGSPESYNLWRGFGVQPAPGDCSLYLEMIEDVICSGDKALARYVFAWMANAVQKPAERPGVVLVFKGIQGTGKGVTAREFGALFGAHFLHLQHAVGRFNSHLANTLLLFADECFWAGDKQHEGVLKALITEPTLPIEVKGKDIISVPNYVRILMASNKDWVVPAALDDRRFCVIDVSEKRAKDEKYFAAIHSQMVNGGAAALLHYLLTLDIADVNLRAIPATAARTEQQMRSLDPITAFWYARLQNGSQFETAADWKEEVVTGELFAEFAKEAQRNGEHRRGHETAFGMQLKKMCPEVRKGDLERARVRMKVYRFPDLAACRVAFEKYAGRTFNWDTTTGAVRETGYDL